MGDRLVVGQRTLTPSTEVRILVPQPNKSESYMLEAKASLLVCVILV